MAEAKFEAVQVEDFTLLNAIPEYIAQFKEALAYLQTSPTAKQLLQDLVEQDVTIRFVENIDGTKYHHEDSNKITPVNKDNVGMMANVARAKAHYPANTIDWNPNALLVYTNAEHSNQLDQDPDSLVDEGVKYQGALSPALMFMHEVGHALDTNYLNNLKNTNNQRYGNDAEQYATKKIENEIAKVLGEGIRSNHGGSWQYSSSSTLHTVANKSSEVLQWQQHHKGDAVIVTGGLFTKKPVHQNEDDDEVINNVIPNFGNYTSKTNTFHLTTPSSMVIQGSLTVRYGQQTQEVNGTTQINIEAGKLKIEAVESKRTPPNHNQSSNVIENDYQQLAHTFAQVIKKPSLQDSNLSALAQQHTDLFDSLAFYNAASTQLPAFVVKHIGDNLVNEIKAGRPLQLAANDRLTTNDSQVEQEFNDEIEP